MEDGRKVFRNLQRSPEGNEQELADDPWSPRWDAMRAGWPAGEQGGRKNLSKPFGTPSPWALQLPRRHRPSRRGRRTRSPNPVPGLGLKGENFCFRRHLKQKGDLSINPTCRDCRAHHPHGKRPPR